MAGRDVFHQQVKRALTSDGWIITNDPLTIPFGNTEVYIDLGAEHLLAAEKVLWVRLLLSFMGG